MTEQEASDQVAANPVGTEQQATPPRELTDANKDGVRAAYQALREGIPGFRTRAAQSHMIGVASRTFGRDSGAAIIEAGTGTGKSLAYLTAGVSVAKAHGLKLMVSTGSVNLQEQLVKRDIPMFIKATGLSCSVALAKGRGRYACIRELQALACDGDQSALNFTNEEDMVDAAWSRMPKPGEAETIQKLYETWKDENWDGDLDSPPLTIDDDLKPLVTTTSGGCTNRRCAFFDRCPFYLARKKLESADLLVVNHSLLIADLMLADEEEGSGGILLPALDKCLVVIDEGHNLAPTAIEANASSIWTGTVHKRMVKLKNVMRASYSATGKDTIGRNSLSEGLMILTGLETDLKALEKEIQASWVPDTDGRDPPLWRGTGGEIPDSWVRYAISLRSTTDQAVKWVKAVRRAVMEVDGLSAGSRDTLPRELGIGLERMSTMSDLWERWAVSAKDSEMPVAKWLTLSTDGSLVLHASAVSVSDFLNQSLFGQAAACIVTSATISAGGDFTAIARDIGLPSDGETVALRSPFNLQEQGTLLVPAIKALPNDQQGHAKEVTQWLDRNLDWDAGNLVIFTSRAKMNLVLESLPAGRQAVCHVQNTKSRSQIIADHTAAIEGGKGSTIFGLASFGEGVDLAGKLCTTVVIPNLPFKVPSDPVAATYAEWLVDQGRRPFDEVSVPEALRVLTQYIGRLLRHEDDSGRVVVLDRRLADKGYGKRMLRALPPFKQVIER